MPLASKGGPLTCTSAAVHSAGPGPQPAALSQGVVGVWLLSSHASVSQGARVARGRWSLSLDRPEL